MQSFIKKSPLNIVLQQKNCFPKNSESRGRSFFGNPLLRRNVFDLILVGWLLTYSRGLVGEGIMYIQYRLAIEV